MPCKLEISRQNACSPLEIFWKSLDEIEPSHLYEQITMSTANANEVVQVFTLTKSAPATYANPSGAFEPMPGTALEIKLKLPSLLVITFCGRGAVTPSGSHIIPFVFIKCEIDGSPCQPNSNPIEFLYPQFCCDSRSFTWMVPEVKPGTHKIAVMWGMGNPTGATLTQRTLIVYAAKI